MMIIASAVWLPEGKTHMQWPHPDKSYLEPAMACAPAATDFTML
jgi:hypothetical protein